jgi:hypothetical protein
LRAVAENWHGEIDGLSLTLTFLRTKRRQAQRGAVLHRDRPADLGMPAPPTRADCPLTAGNEPPRAPKPRGTRRAARQPSR